MKRQGENTRPYTFILEQTVVLHKDAVILNTEISIGNGIGCFHITLYSDENRRRGRVSYVLWMQDLGGCKNEDLYTV